MPTKVLVGVAYLGVFNHPQVSVTHTIQMTFTAVPNMACNKLEVFMPGVFVRLRLWVLHSSLQASQSLL